MPTVEDLNVSLLNYSNPRRILTYALRQELINREEEEKCSNYFFLPGSNIIMSGLQILILVSGRPEFEAISFMKLPSSFKPLCISFLVCKMNLIGYLHQGMVVEY